MKILARPLKGEAFPIEADPEERVEDLKQKIASARPEFPAEQQKLIHSGKILQDGAFVKDYNIKEGGFVVVMVAKVKPPPPPAANPTPAAVPTPAVAPAAAPATGMAAPVESSTAVDEARVSQLCDMGFPRPEVERCLRAASNNPDLAVEYLMSGIPQDAQLRAAAPQGLDSQHGGTGLEALEQLAGHPGLEGLAGQVPRDAASLERIMQALSASHPELAQTIAENQEELLDLLQGADDDDSSDEEDDDAVRQPVAVDLTQAEQAAVERLGALGFDREAVLEAYLACGKNEELAASLLFDGTDFD